MRLELWQKLLCICAALSLSIAREVFDAVSWDFSATTHKLFTLLGYVGTSFELVCSVDALPCLSLSHKSSLQLSFGPKHGIGKAESFSIIISLVQ